MTQDHTPLTTSRADLLARLEEERIGQGRPTKFYELHDANKANYANNKQPRGFAVNFEVREQSEQSEQTPAGSSDSSQVRIVRELQKESATRMDAASSPSSHSSHTQAENDDEPVEVLL